MYKVFINDNPLIIGDKNEIINIFPHAVFKTCKNHEQALLILNELDEDKTGQIIAIKTNNIGKTTELFFGNHKYIEAAGGLVKNQSNEYLFIYRLDKWDLPKGKIEKGESIEEGALREVEEECGIHQLVIQKEIPSTYHTYFRKGKPHLKRTYWYLMDYNGHEELVPQIEEDITKVEWRSAENLKDIFVNTYGSIEEVLKEIK